jgi:hypothetical protein
MGQLRKGVAVWSPVFGLRPVIYRSALLLLQGMIAENHWR